MTTKGIDLSGKSNDMTALRDAIFKYLSNMRTISHRSISFGIFLTN